MKTNKILLIAALCFVTAAVCAKKKPEVFDTYTYGKNAQGTTISLKFEKGKEHNHPLFAVWLADSAGNYIQTLYVSESVGKGFFRRASRKTGHWQAGEIQRPATLPYWAHQRKIINEFSTYLPTPKQPVPDAYTGATPQASFILTLLTDNKLYGNYKLFLEVNQSWDWNEFWTNNKFPDDKEYKTSSQPALIYSADFDTRKTQGEIQMKPVGRSHHSGSDGNIYTDLQTLTTALKIAKRITFTVR